MRSGCPAAPAAWAPIAPSLPRGRARADPRGPASESAQRAQPAGAGALVERQRARTRACHRDDCARASRRALREHALRAPLSEQPASEKPGSPRRRRQPGARLGVPRRATRRPGSRRRVLCAAGDSERARRDLPAAGGAASAPGLPRHPRRRAPLGGIALEGGTTGRPRGRQPGGQHKPIPAKRSSHASAEHYPRHCCSSHSFALSWALGSKARRQNWVAARSVRGACY